MADDKQSKCPACDGSGECDGAKCGTCDGTGQAPAAQPVEKAGGVIEAAAHAFPAAAHMIHVAEGLGITAGAAAVAGHHGGKVVNKLRGLRDKGVPKAGRMYVMGNKQYKVAHTDAVGTLMHHVPTGHGPQGESQFIKAKQWGAHIKSGKIAPLATGHHKSEDAGDLEKATETAQQRHERSVAATVRASRDMLGNRANQSAHGIRTAPPTSKTTHITPGHPAYGKPGREFEGAFHGAAPGRFQVINNLPQGVAIKNVGAAVGSMVSHDEWANHVHSGAIKPYAGTKIGRMGKSQEGPGMASVFAELNKAMGVANEGAAVEKSGKVNAKPDADEAKAAAANNPFVGPDACLWQDFTAGLQPGNALGEVTRTHSGGVVLKYPVLDGNGTIHVNMDESTWKGLVHNIGQLGDKVKDPPMSGKTGIKKSEGEGEGEAVAKSEAEVTAPATVGGPYEPLAGDRATDAYGRGYVIKSVESNGVVMGYADDPSAEDAMLAKSDVVRMFSDPNLTVEREGRVVSVNGTEEYRDLAREYSRVRIHRRPGDPE